MARLFSSVPELRTLLIGGLVMGLVCLVVFGSSPRNFASSRIFKRSRMAALIIVGAAVFSSALYLAHNQFRLSTLFWLGSILSLAGAGLFFATSSPSRLPDGSPDVDRASGLFLLYGVAIGCGLASLSVVVITVAVNSAQ